MGCTRPIPAHQEAAGGEIILWPPLGTHNLALPCGRCTGCRSDKATQWGHRCQHEASQYQHNTFLTLTYDDAHLPAEGYLDAEALQRFLKRLRKRASRRDSSIQTDQTRNIRYLASGEYGRENGRPHYHLALFNCGFEYQRRVKKDLYATQLLLDLWPNGDHTFGPFTPASANYIAQYTMKKQGAGDHDADGVYRPPPFLRMSTHPAIGTEWLKKFKTDLQHGYLIAGGIPAKTNIPRTYIAKLETIDPELYTQIKLHQLKNRYQKHIENTDTQHRRWAQDIIHAQIKREREL